MKLLLRWLISALAVLVLARLLPGVEVDSYVTALIVAIVLALLNIFLKPLLIFFTIPITVITLGLFLLVINAAIILTASYLVDGFEVVNFWWALIFSILLSVITSVIQVGKD